MKLFLIPLLSSAFILSLLSQENEFPMATATDRPDVVVSPYDPSRQLDVAGLEPGSLAEDPVAKKIFRIPFANSKPIDNKKPMQGNTNRVLPKEPLSPSSAPTPTIPSNPAPTNNTPGSEVPADLLSFLFAFNQNSTVNDPDALLPFYADTVQNYFGVENASKSKILADRTAYISRYPDRKYIIDGAPILLAKNGNVYDVMVKIRYAVNGSGKNLNGVVSDFFKIKKGARQYEIISINEGKSTKTTADIEIQNPIPLEIPQTDNQLGIGTAYSRFEMDQINLFLNALNASGEVNDPTAIIDFMHPQISSYYGLANPSESDLILQRSSSIKRWPERKYSLKDKPFILSSSPGTWNVISKTNYEYRNGAMSSNGVATTQMRITHTNQGLKVMSVDQER